MKRTKIKEKEKIEGENAEGENSRERRKSNGEDLIDLNKDDDLSLFVKRFNKFLKIRGNQRKTNFKHKRRTKDSSSTPKCYECN